MRGEYTTPKSARGSRSVPLAGRVAAALDELGRRTAFAGDADLVFGHPQLGKPLDRSMLRKRFNAALVAAGVREVRLPRLAAHVRDARRRGWSAKACKAAAVPLFSPHDFRHRRISLLHLQGVPWAVIGAQLGQRNLAVTANIYSHVLTDERELDYAELLARVRPARSPCGPRSKITPISR